MLRNVLLVEPNYKNKYPPIGLMKLATYYRKLGDNVRFFKGDLKDLAAEIIMDRLIANFAITMPEMFIKKYYEEIFSFIKKGQKACLSDVEELLQNEVYDALMEYHRKYKKKEYFTNPPFDVVCIATLFTFSWSITVDTINFVKQLCKTKNRVLVGGIASSIVPNEIYKDTGIYPIEGLLNRPRILDDDNDLIIDDQPLDYSILEEIDYTYPAADAYFAYMTRGCPNKCSFCAVPTLEPDYCGYISLKEQIEFTKKHYGEKRHLLLLDNNVLASNCYEKIIDEIKEMGFFKGATYLPENEYDIAFNNLMRGIKYSDEVIGFNDKAYIRKIVKIYHETLNKLKGDEAGALYSFLENSECLSIYTATKSTLEKNNQEFHELYKKLFKPKSLIRHIDFNQGVEGKLVTDDKMKKLAETNIRPLRIAFDHIELKNSYEKSIRIAAAHGINNLSNYMLYNYKDKPEDLYLRMKLNIELCDELDISIYSFPMKYHPVANPKYFRSRNYLGIHWNRKFIRAIQAVLNSTKGKVGKGKSFFEEAFGETLDEFIKILWMPETFIIYRRKHDKFLREKLLDRYTKLDGDETDLANEWWAKWKTLNDNQLEKAKEIISANIFTDESCVTGNIFVDDILKFYLIKREK